MNTNYVLLASAFTNLYSFSVSFLNIWIIIDVIFVTMCTIIIICRNVLPTSSTKWSSEFALLRRLGILRTWRYVQTSTVEVREIAFICSENSTCYHNQLLTSGPETCYYVFDVGKYVANLMMQIKCWLLPRMDMFDQYMMSYNDYSISITKWEVHCMLFIILFSMMASTLLCYAIKLQSCVQAITI